MFPRNTDETFCFKTWAARDSISSQHPACGDRVADQRLAAAAAPSCLRIRDSYVALLLLLTHRSLGSVRRELWVQNITENFILAVKDTDFNFFRPIQPHMSFCSVIISLSSRKTWKMSKVVAQENENHGSHSIDSEEQDCQLFQNASVRRCLICPISQVGPEVITSQFFIILLKIEMHICKLL